MKAGRNSLSRIRAPKNQGSKSAFNGVSLQTLIFPKLFTSWELKKSYMIVVQYLSKEL